MTVETCLKQAANCRKHNDEAGALMYEKRAELKGWKRPQEKKVDSPSTSKEKEKSK